MDSIDPCLMIDTHDKGVRIQLLSMNTHVYFLIYVAKPQSDQRWKRYGQEDAKAIVMRLATNPAAKWGRQPSEISGRIEYELACLTQEDVLEA